MNQRILGKSGIHVSEISFGGVEIGIPYGIGVEGVTDMPSSADSIKLLHAALEKGINFFDTARLYGKSEELFGKAFADKRERVVICTKCEHLPTNEKQLSDPGRISDIINASLKKSLAALQTDYVDVFMVHNANVNILKNELITETFLKLKKNGNIRATGVSTYTVEETQLAIKQGVWDVIQLSFNLMDQRQAVLFDVANQAGIGLVVRSVLIKGILSDRGRNLHPALKNVQDHRNRYLDLLDNNITTLSALATKFALSFSEISSVLVGIDRMKYLQQAIETANGNYLNSRTLAQAKELVYPEPDFINLKEWDQKGWLK